MARDEAGGGRPAAAVALALPLPRDPRAGDGWSACVELLKVDVLTAALPPRRVRGFRAGMP